VIGYGLVLTEQVTLRQLAAFSLLARWIDECTVDLVQAARRKQPRASARLSTSPEI
jgi:hypothetical protein